MRGRRLLGPALAGVALLASALPAQRAPLRSGLWFELGRGTGNIRISCTTCERPTSLFGGSGFLRIGGSLSRKVLLSLEVFSLLDDRFEARGTDSTVTLETYAVGPTVLWYPWSSGFHLSAGMGVAGVELALPVTEDVPELLASGTGVGVEFTGATRESRYLDTPAAVNSFGEARLFLSLTSFSGPRTLP